MKRTIEWLESAKKGDDDSQECIDAAIGRLHDIRAKVVALRDEYQATASRLTAHEKPAKRKLGGYFNIRVATLKEILAILDCKEAPHD